jgi:tetratricopeptide (TPR) repeat protein
MCWAIAAGLTVVGCASSPAPVGRVPDPYAAADDGLAKCIRLASHEAYDEAITECGRLHRTADLARVDRAWALTMLGKCHHRRGGRVGGRPANAPSYRADVDDARRSLEEALTAAGPANRLPGYVGPHVPRFLLADIHNALGMVYRQTYPLGPAIAQFGEAERLLDEIARSPDGADVAGALPQEKMKVLGNLIAVLLDAGNFGAARGECEELEGLCGARPDPHAHQTLGVAYLEFGDFRKATHEFAMARELVREGGVDDSEPRILAETLLNSAACANAMEDFSDAERLLGESETALRKAPGDARLEAAIRSNWGRLHLSRIHLRKARGAFEEALGLQIEHLGHEHPDTLGTKLELGDLAKREGHLGEASRLYETVLAGLQRALGATHPRTLAAQLELELMNGALDPAHCASALTSAEATLRDLDAALGSLHPNAVFAAFQVANLAAGCGDLEAGKRFDPLFDEAVARYRELPKEQPNLVVLQGWILFADIGVRRGPPYTRPLDLYTDAEAVYERIFSDQHLSVVGVRAKRAALLHKMGQTDEARELYARTIRDMNPELEWHPVRAELFGGFCEALLAKGDVDGAKKAGRDGLDVLTNTFRREDPAVAAYVERYRPCLSP